ncbi:N-acetylmuramoyl-L-alanine amidase [Hathewaya histolytica]|uniref:N-acetylmuramoyl-L-alanine amidase n=1 Tax=Hathewaya histolytica TaxID=1498 RepID=UPI003B6734B6
MNKKTTLALTALVALGANNCISKNVQAINYRRSNYTNQKKHFSYGPTINGIPVKKQLITTNYDKGVNITPKYIVIHDTDNTDIGANAQANRDYFENHPNVKSSAHYVIDEVNIIQALNDTSKGWHSGEVYNPKSNNSNSIAIELCVNKDNNFNKTLKNGIALTRYLMNKYNIPPENVIRHHDVTGKICPKVMMKNGAALWNYFRKSIEIGTNTSSFKANAKITGVKTNLNVRNTPNIKGTILGYILNNDKVEVISSGQNWYKVKYNTYSGIRTGYISADYVRFL